MEHLKVGQSWQAFRKEHRLGNWWFVLIPSIVLSLIISAVNFIPILGQLLAFLLPLIFTVYIYRIRMKLYLTKENTDFVEELQGLHYRRDFLARLAWDIPVGIAVTVAMIPLLLIFGSTVIWIINISYQYESVGGSLFSLLLFFFISLAVFMAIDYFISIPFRAVVFMAATDSKDIIQEGFDFSDVVSKAKLAWQIFKNYEYRNKIF